MRFRFTTDEKSVLLISGIVAFMSVDDIVRDGPHSAYFIVLSGSALVFLTIALLRMCRDAWRRGPDVPAS